MLNLHAPVMPSPMPTVTITQIVIVPTSAPTPIITFTPQPADMTWQDIALGDFGAGVIGACAALLGVYWLISRETRARAEQAILSQASVLLTSIRNFERTLEAGPAERGHALSDVTVNALLLIAFREVKKPGVKERVWEWVHDIAACIDAYDHVDRLPVDAAQRIINLCGDVVYQIAEWLENPLDRELGTAKPTGPPTKV
ncbi:hypothetical protein GT755_35745 [Herbidospora sp. NEAU-GS84]|uniref:Uncharacterized protein n=1 Tax=Herbidospora solisilvae TaxID=2696284 RepID=A0A7C9N1Y4_9ACTN|nr:hypothetical protein [Herbidospora solisilvae]NAS27011.1 hypothetical protein [Herbidospora solisilvae]